MTRRVFTILVLVGAVGFAACGKNEGAAPGEAPASPPAAGAKVPAHLAALLPAKDEVPGWAPSKPPRVFNADNLWELINGAADGFVAYGVQQVVAADYVHPERKAEAVVEVYQMKDALNAYGKYAEERNPDYRFIDVGNEGYSGGTSVNFWKGQYYVKMTSFDEKTAPDIEKLARALAGKISQPGAVPRELAYLPKDDQVPRTDRYIPKDVLAQSYFVNGFEARYKAGAKESRLVLMDLGADAAARDALGRYREFVAKGGKGVKDLPRPGDGGFAGQDSFYGNVAAVRAGKHIVVSLGAASEAAGVKQLAQTIAQVR